MTSLYFSTVVRAAPLSRGGELVTLDWDEKTVVPRVPVGPLDQALRDRNPRGNSRGGRGIWLTGDDVLVATYDGVRIFDQQLKQKGEVSGGLLVGLHEVLMTEPGRLWVAATSLDAVFEIDLAGGRLTAQYWPREMGAFQEAFGVEPATLDKTSDLRAAYLSPDHAKHPSHLHLNAVARWQGRTLALINRFGAIIDLDNQRVLVQDAVLKGGHNLVVSADEATVCATREFSVRTYDLNSGRLQRAFQLADLHQLRPLLAGRHRARAGRAIRRALGRQVIAKPLFLRGLDLVDGRLFVGLSPATIVCLDASNGSFIDQYTYSDDVRVCVHGLRVVRTDGHCERLDAGPDDRRTS